MKKLLVLGSGILMLGFMVMGCGGTSSETVTTTTATATTTTVPSVTSTSSTTSSTSMPISGIFNVSGAVAVATATSASGAGIRAADTSATELLKMTASGELTSFFGSAYGGAYHQPISVIEKGPDGSLYVGFTYGIWITTGEVEYTPSTMPGMPSGESTTYRMPIGKNIAFFKIKTDGSVEVVDDTITGMGSWYSAGSDYSELPAKQVQFDSDGNVYYLGRSSSGMGIETTGLKKRTVAGDISQIGSSAMQVRDFLVAPNGSVLFHGSNASSWNIEWLRVYYTGGVLNIFYNDMSSPGSYGYLRTYYIDKNGDLLMVGSNLNISLDPEVDARKYSGVIRIDLDATTGQPTSIEVLYDDYNMYSDTGMTIGSQLNWGYWDPSSGGTNRKFFVSGMSGTSLPLTLESGVTETEIRAFIRGKYKAITADTLNDVSFEGQTTSESWNITDMLDALINANITGETWGAWKTTNGLNGIPFSNAKKLLYGDDGAMYAVMNLDSWGSSSSNGDKIFCIINASGEADPFAFSQGTYKQISKAKCFGDYIVYSASNGSGYYKLYRLERLDQAAVPFNLTSGITGLIEIYNFSYNASTGKVLYDVYNYDTDLASLIEQNLVDAVATESTSTGYRLTDVVPFESTEEAGAAWVR